MRCPKCGFISFDHLDSCRKCDKPLGSVSLVLRGSAYNCQAPAFLRISQPEEERISLDFSLANVIEEVEIEAPDVGLISGLGDFDSAPAQSATANNPSTPAMFATAAAPTVPPQSISVDSSDQDISLAWPDEEEAVAFIADGEQTPSFAPIGKGMELPPDLADISDLAPPGRTAKSAESKDDFDLDLDLDLGFDLRDVEENAESERTEQVSVVDVPKVQAASVDMDSDLDFELDLGGLSLHDYGGNQK